MFTFYNLALLLPIAVFLHVTEEFLFPGGFIEWYQELVPSKTKGIRPGYLVWINTLMMAVCIFPIHYGETLNGVSIWFCIASIAAANACFHIWGVVKLKKYSPGVITGTVLYIPLFIVGAQQLISSGSISLFRVILFIALAIGYHIFSVIRQAK